MKRNLPVFHGMNFERTIPVYLIVDPTTYNNVDYAGDDLSADIDVGSEAQEWDGAADDAWILLLGKSSPGDDTVTIRVAANSTGLPRQGTVTFTSSGCADVVVTVNQLANPV